RPALDLADRRFQPVAPEALPRGDLDHLAHRPGTAMMRVVASASAGFAPTDSRMSFRQPGGAVKSVAGSGTSRRAKGAAVPGGGVTAISNRTRTRASIGAISGRAKAGNRSSVTA